MTCPADVTAILLEIITYGVLNARFAGRSGNAAQAAVEAEHVHNLPDVIANYLPERLQYYWDVERVCYLTDLAKANPGQGAGFESLWDQLRPHVECHQPVSAAS
jgi:hypothetical protein